MARTDLNIPTLGRKFVDLRDSIPGDSYNWSWVRELSEVNYLAIHHSATPDTQTSQDIANEHINNNGWGGIGYHFLIAKDGAVYYVGDISTARANAANLNEAVLGICLIGNFLQDKIPSSEQLDSAHKLCEFLIKYQDLPNVTSWASVRGHKELPNQSTNCPGDSWSSWRIQIVEGISLGENNSSLVFNSSTLESQVSNLQASLASVNARAIFLAETLQQREQEIAKLKASSDETLTIPQALVKLYTSLLPPGKES